MIINTGTRRVTDGRKVLGKQAARNVGTPLLVGHFVVQLPVLRRGGNLVYAGGLDI